MTVLVNHIRPILLGTTVELGTEDLGPYKDGIVLFEKDGTGAIVLGPKENAVRIGRITNEDEDAAGYGAKLYLSGGPSFSADGYDSDNSDELWLARYNLASNSTELRVQIGDSPVAIDAFVVGYTDFGTGNWMPLYRYQTDGMFYLVGGATVWDDIICPFDSARVPAANAPTWATFQGNLNAYTFGVNDLLELTAELLHGYKHGSTIEFHIHWATNGVGGTDRAVKWEIEYTIANMDSSDGIGDAFPATTVVSQEVTIPAGTADLTHMYTSVADVALGSGEIGAIVKFRIRRIAAAGTDPDYDPFGIQVGIHYESDTIGSNSESSKT